MRTLPTLQKYEASIVIFFLWVDSTKIITEKPRAFKTQPTQCSHCYSPTVKQTVFSHRRQKLHLCQTAPIKMVTGQIKSLAVGLPGWKIFPNGKHEPTAHRCWKTEWCTANNEYLKSWLALWKPGYSKLAPADRKDIFIHLLSQFLLQAEIMCAGQAAIEAHAPRLHIESVRKVLMASEFYLKNKHSARPIHSVLFAGSWG